MAEQVLSQQLLWSDGGRSLSYLFHLSQLQLLRADYSSAAASLREALSYSNKVFEENGMFVSMSLTKINKHDHQLPNQITFSLFWFANMIVM